ncbi:NADPH:quinone reductase [Andreprevotia lacus DSM 23236]|uniref:NADPH:quinone reductase n=1 Tax=Andreprevotia lacus DSM 23236 TaxID=1121001 RepID=A0A1W1Y144_9NEIS|nr:NAD(P)-dependent alcohol dehydrogenase [Andreprevotia lacus]SMC29883.1 NADPH:quinone reductase [Andreprevotia lacus DSM 23236]
MQSYHMNLGAGLDGLLRKTRPVPQPGSGEVLVKVAAVSLNYRELMILLQGRYPLPVKPDVVAVSDGAGEVVAVGPGVTQRKVGERVVASIFPYWQDGPFTLEHAAQLGGSLDGMLSEYVLLPETALLPVPDYLSLTQAATLPCAAVTAWHALTGGRPLQPGQTVLTLGTGSVSLFALQLAQLFGARVIATTSSADKAARLRELGADAVIDYRQQPDWAAEVRRLTQGQGVDLVVEVAGATLAQSLQAVRLGGEIALIGSVGGGGAVLDASAILASGATLRPLAVGSRARFAAMLTAMAAGKVQPVIDRVFSFAQVAEAFAYYAGQSAPGKVVIKVGAL